MIFASLLAATLFSIPGNADSEVAKNARITAESGDFDREEGVIYFEKAVHIEYDKDYELFADRLFVLLEGTNQLSRVVAFGNVSVINGERKGRCDSAEFSRFDNRIMMRGKNSEEMAQLVDGGEEGNELNGDLIRFWLDSEQIEVENSKILFRGKMKKEDLL